MKLHLLLFLSIIIFSTKLVHGQNEAKLPHSIIYFVGSAYGSMATKCRTDVAFPNQEKFLLDHYSVVSFKIYSEGKIAIALEINCPATQYTSSTTRLNQLILNVKRGNEYFIRYDGNDFVELEKKKIQKALDKCTRIEKEENIESPINKESLNDIARKEGKRQGTCFLISSIGYFITNFHCVENCKEITIKGIDGDFTTKYGATIVASDPSNDLVLLKIGNKNLKFENLPFSLRSSGVAQAEKVFTLGFPTAEFMGEEVKITEGIISAKSGPQGDISKFQISAAVNPGNSGGPLIDEKGNIIGVIYAKSTIAESAGYAIKSSYLETFLKNVDGFEFPTYINTISEKPLTEKVAILKKYIFIVETN